MNRVSAHHFKSTYPQLLAVRARRKTIRFRRTHEKSVKITFKLNVSNPQSLFRVVK